MKTKSFFVRAGDEVAFSKTVGETDVYLFAGITGDFSPNHVNAAVMSQSKYGQRVAHGALIVGFMSTGSTRMIETFGGSALGKATAVSLGYDRLRFIAPVFIGDTITVHYRIDRVEPERDRSYAAIVVTNQHGAQVAVADHILKWVSIQATEPVGTAKSGPTDGGQKAAGKRTRKAAAKRPVKKPRKYRGKA